MTLPEAPWSVRNPVGQVVRPTRPALSLVKEVKPNPALVPAQGTEPRAYQRMREAKELDKRLKRELQEVKEGKKKQVSKY